MKKRVSSITDSKESCRGIRKLPESINQPMSAKHYLLTISLKLMHMFCATEKVSKWVQLSSYTPTVNHSNSGLRFSP